MSAFLALFDPWLDGWIVAVGVLCAMACALPGCFLLLRRQAMMGDAISHAVLPGLVIAYLVTGSRESVPMFVGAAVVGVLTALLVQVITRQGRVEEGAAMGVVFVTLFALGLLLIRQAADRVDLDPDCVIYGALEQAPLDTWAIAGRDIPRAAVINGAALLLNALFVLLFYKELKVTSFDPALADAQGIPSGLFHYLLMTLTALTTIAAFESVGSILVIAMLVVPPATALLLTERLGVMIVLALGVAAASAVLGHAGAVALPPLVGFVDTSTSGMIGVAAGALFAASFLFAPRHGLASRLVHRARLRLDIARDDVLATLYRWHERVERGEAAEAAAPDAVLREAVGAPWLAPLVLARLRRRGHIAAAAGAGTPPPAAAWTLTDRGERRARHLVRQHRLWEDYLVHEVGLRPDHVHGTAERLEHLESPPLAARLDAATGSPALDPHHRPIPALEAAPPIPPDGGRGA